MKCTQCGHKFKGVTQQCDSCRQNKRRYAASPKGQDRTHRYNNGPSGRAADRRRKHRAMMRRREFGRSRTRGVELVYRIQDPQTVARCQVWTVEITGRRPGKRDKGENLVNLEKHNRLEADILAALEKVGEKHNITFSTKGGSYSPSGSDEDVFRIAAFENTTSGQPRDIDREAFLDYIKMWDKPNMQGFLKKEWLDATFRDRKHDYTIVGYRSGRKNCIVTKRDDGKQYLWSVAAIEAHVKAVAAA